MSVGSLRGRTSEDEIDEVMPHLPPLLLLLILASNSRRNDESNVEERTEACGMDVLLLSRAAA